MALSLSQDVWGNLCWHCMPLLHVQCIMCVMCSETRLWGSHTETQVNVTTNTLDSLSIFYYLLFFCKFRNLLCSIYPDLQIQLLDPIWGHNPQFKKLRPRQQRNQHWPSMPATPVTHSWLTTEVNFHPTFLPPCCNFPPVGASLSSPLPGLLFLPLLFGWLDWISFLNSSPSHLLLPY